MPRHALVPALLLVLPALLSAQSPSNPALHDRIMHAVAAAAAARKQVFPDQPATGNFRLNSGDPRLATLRSIDSTSAAEIESILDANGWPGVSVVGSAASHLAFTMARNGRLPLKRKALALMKQADAGGDVLKGDLAYMTDEVQVALAQPQTFGTAFTWSLDHFVPAPIDDSARVDERRRLMGLGPLADSVAARARAVVTSFPSPAAPSPR